MNDPMWPPARFHGHPGERAYIREVGGDWRAEIIIGPEGFTYVEIPMRIKTVEYERPVSSTFPIGVSIRQVQS